MRFKRLIATVLSISLVAGNVFYVSHPLAVNANAQATAVVSEDGLVLYSSFDEGTVEGKTVKDLTGRGNDGAITGNIQLVDGIKGKGIKLNNSVTGEKVDAEQYVNYGKGADLKFGTDDFSLSFWMKTENNGVNNGCIMGDKDYTSGSNVGIAVGNYIGSQTDVRMNFSASKGSRVEVKGINANDNSWHHFVSTFDRDGDMTVYMDGEKFSSSDMRSQVGQNADTAFDFIIGAAGNKKYGMKNCIIDEFRVYKKAITPEKVTELFEEVDLDKMVSNGLVMYSSFDAATITGTDVKSVKDLTDRGNNGEIHGNVATVPGIKGEGVAIDNGEKAGQGASVADQYINYKQPADLLFGTTNFSLSFWMKTENHGANNGTIMSNKDYSSGSNLGWAVGNYTNPSDTDVRMNFSAKAKERIELKKITANDDSWHYFVSTFDRSGDMIVYMDGKEFGKTSMTAQKNMSVDTTLDFVLGADGNKVSGMSDITVDELRVYNKVMSPKVVDTLYKADGAGLTIQKMEDKMSAITPDASYTEEAIAEMNAAIAKAKTDIAGMGISDTLTVMDLLQSQFDQFLEGSGNVDLDAAMADGLVMHSSFDAATITGTTTKTVTDLTNRGNNGEIHGAVASVTGIKGEGISIDNGDKAGLSVAADQYIDYKKPADLMFGTKDFSLGFWMKTTDYGASNGTIMGNKNYDSGSNVGWAVGNFNNPNAKDIRMNFSAKDKERIELSGITANDNQWHYFFTTFQRNGQMTVYLDGKEYSKKDMTSHSGNSVDTEYGFIVGADGRTFLGMSDIVLDEMRVYSKAIKPEVVGALYQTEGADFIIKGMEDKVADIKPGSVYTQASIDMIKQAIAATKAAIVGAGASVTIEKLNELQVKFDEFLEGEEPIISFQVVSDAHISKNDFTEDNSKQLIAGLQDMKAMDPDSSAFISLGDNAHQGTEAQYTGFYNIIDKYKPVTDDRILIALGNHDVRGPNSADWNKDPSIISKYWPTAYNLYMTKNKPYMPDTNGKTYYDRWIDGYHFIVLNTENGIKDACSLSDEQLAWFEEKIAENAQPGKPIFVLGHQPLNDTHWRGNILNGFGEEVDEVKEIMTKYPQAVYMSGHIHNGFGIAEVIDREYGTSVDLPSYNASDCGYKNKGIGYHVQVYEDTIVFRARNFVTSTWLPKFDVEVKTQSLPVLYKRIAGLQSSDFTPEQWARIQELKAETEGIFNSKYMQDNIDYEDTSPPPVQLFPAEVRTKINTIGDELRAIIGEDPVVGNPEFIALREKYLDTLLGGELDKTNSAVQTYIENIDKTAKENWDSMIKSDVTDRTNLWADYDMSFISGSGAAAKEHSGHISETYYRIRDIAIAYGTEGCELYQNSDVKKELILALDHMYENYYNESDSKNPFFGNWWHWEIGSPIALMNIALILYDDLTASQIRNYTESINRFTNVCDVGSGYYGSPKIMTGANLIDKGMAVALVGIATDNPLKLDHIKKAYKSVFQYVTTGDGFYEDGSYIQHEALAYMGGYGASLYGKLSVLFNVLHDSKYELTYDDNAQNLVYDMIFKGIEPFMYNGTFTDMISGRGITRKTTSDKLRGVDMLNAIMLMSDAMPDQESKTRFDSLVKYCVGLDPDYFYSNSGNIASIMKANEIMKDSTIQPKTDFKEHILFADMDKAVHTMPEYSMALSMHSNRTYGHELINDEGKRTWNISDGMTYLYNGDRDQYSDGYWATVDPRRLAGTTAEFVMLGKGAGDRIKNVYNWVGGSNLGEIGAVGMQYKTTSATGNSKGGADVKKSWFMFEDEIVAMGSGISSTTGNYVETIIDNRKIKKDGSNVVTIDGATADITDNSIPGNPAIPSKGKEFTNPKWMHLEGNVAGSDIGYYFPTDTTIKALKEHRTGDWSDQGTDTGAEENDFATFWFEHGQNPSDETYEYIVLPNKTAEETADYAANSSIQILENSTDAHGVKNEDLGITAVNFWNDTTKSVGGITTNKKASVTLKEANGEIEIGVSDPTQANNGTIELEFTFAGGDVIVEDDTIEIIQSTPFLKLSVNVSGTNGKTSTIKMKKAVLPQKDKNNLAHVLQLAKGLNLTQFSNADKTALDALIAQAEQILGDDETTIQQVRDSEVLLTKELARLRRLKN